MDETVVNGDQIFYTKQFGIGGKDECATWLTGLVNSAPDLCCAFIGCRFTAPYNNYFGGQGTIFITCLFSAIECLWYIGFREQLVGHVCYPLWLWAVELV